MERSKIRGQLGTASRTRRSGECTRWDPEKLKDGETARIKGRSGALRRCTGEFLKVCSPVLSISLGAAGDPGAGGTRGKHWACSPIAMKLVSAAQARSNLPCRVPGTCRSSNKPKKGQCRVKVGRKPLPTCVKLPGSTIVSGEAIVSDEIDHGGDVRDYIDTRGHWMDYKIEREFSSSNPPGRLLRFMPLEQYLYILTTRQLYIPRATEYDDPYDCAFPGSLSDAILQALLESSNEPEFSLPGELDHSELVQKAEGILARELDNEFSWEVPERWFVSCWHAGESLTDLMWRSYGGHKGVCISCDGPSLLKQLQNTVWMKRNPSDKDRGKRNFEFLFGYVDYERPVFEVEPDEEAGPTVTVRHPAFHKHHFFRLDAEFRFAMRLTTAETAYYLAGAELDLTVCNASVSTSPLCPPWIANSVEAVTRKFYPDIEFRRLSLEPE